MKLSSKNKAKNKVQDKNESALAALQSCGKTLGLTVLGAFIVMAAMCMAVFFMVVKGQETVLVPDVTGKMLSDALIEMQDKELYPKIQMRYSETPDDFYTVLKQTPEAGSIVKAGRRISLVVSRGVVLDRLENYIGMNIDDLRIKLQTIFAGSAKPLVVLSEPMYKTDNTPAGTILAQNPPEGTQISSPVHLELVVSRGTDSEAVIVPELVGLSIDKTLKIIDSTKLTFDFTGHVSSDSKEAVISDQQIAAGTSVKPYTRIHVDISLPDHSDNVCGIFYDTLPLYPYAVSLQLVAYPEGEGEPYVIASFNHPGGTLSIPYSVQAGTSLVLMAIGEEHSRITVQ